MYILQVIPITKSIRVSSLSYFSTKDISLGTVVSVPLRKKELKAIVVGKESVSNMKFLLKSADFQLRNVLEIYDQELFSKSFLLMCSELAKYHSTYTGMVMDCLTPKAITKNIDTLSQDKEEVSARDKKRSELLILQRSRADRFDYYKIRARELFTNQSSLCIVCPTITEAQEVFNKVTKGIEQRSYLINGSLTAKKLTRIYSEMIESKEPILIIGTASCISLNLKGIQEYIIHESSSSAYDLSIAQPYLNIRLCVERLAFHAQATCVYADTTIDVNTWYRVQNKEIQIIEPSNQKVINSKKLNTVSFTLGTKKQSEAERIKELSHNSRGFHPLHVTSMTSIQKALSNHKKIFVYVPKKGMAPNIVCKECGNLAVSPHSHLPYSLYIHNNKKTGKKEAVYICNKTKERVPAFDQCQFCKGVNLMKMGIATSSVAEHLLKEFPETCIEILDGQHTKTKKSLRELKKKYQEPGAMIVVGTSKALNELPSWDLGIIVTLAPLMSTMSYRNEENIVHLLSRLQEKTTELLLLQDRKDTLSHLTILKEGMYLPFVNTELELRKQYHFPPYETLIELTITINKKDLKEQYYYYLKRFEHYDPSIIIRPHSSKEVVLILMMKVDESQWNVNHQDEDLTENLNNMERNVHLRINSQRIA